MDDAPSDETHREAGCGDADTVEAQVMLGEVREHMFGRRDRAAVGRFELRQLLGRGAHGSVYLGVDPELQRSVAVKLLNATSSEGTARTRLMREAQSLAQLNHPNVLTVHEVGVAADRVFIAMEYVEAGTLAQWCRDHPPNDRSRFVEVLDMAIGAARGLSVAHEAGIVHRDIKPANILVGSDGRPRIADFGLARASDGVRQTVESDEVLTVSAIDATLTRTGEVVGTPAYMAPEQFAGRGDAASDQYSLCATFWEAAYGERPFDAENLAALVGALQLPPRPPPAARTEVPGWWREVLARGLLHEPQERWPSVAALLAELKRRRRGRPRRIAVVAGVATVALGAVGLQAWLASRAQRCSGADTQLAGAWDAARRDEVEAAVLLTELPYAENAWRHAAGQIDAYVDQWKRMHTEACEATTLRGEQSVEVMDLRMACLHRAKMQLVAAVEVLAESDAEVVKNAANVVGTLLPLRSCADVEGLQADVEPPDPQEVQAVESVRALLAEARAERAAGRYAVAKASADEAQDRLAGLDYLPVRTEVALQRGSVLRDLGEFDASEAALRQALEQASRRRRWALMQSAATNLIYVVGISQGRPAEGLGYREIALGLARGDADKEAGARSHLASVLGAQGKYAESEAEYRGVLAVREKILPPDHPRIGTTRHNLAYVLAAQAKYEEAEAESRKALASSVAVLGADHPEIAARRSGLAGVLVARGKYAEAEPQFRQAVRLFEESLGPAHPDVGKARGNLASVLSRQGKSAEAEALLRATLGPLEKALGAAHPDIAQMRNNLGNQLHAQGKDAEAEVEYRRALALFEEALGSDHPQVAGPLNNLATLLQGGGKHREAEAAYRRAIGVLEKRLGSDHPDLGPARTNLANTLGDQGRYVEAEAEVRRALASRLGALGPEHPDVARSRIALAAILLERGRPKDALPLAEQAWAGSTDLPPRSRATIAFVLAEALAATRSGAQARQRARELAERALRTFAGEHPDPDRAAEIRTWLDAHPAP